MRKDLKSQRKFQEMIKEGSYQVKERKNSKELSQLKKEAGQESKSNNENQLLIMNISIFYKSV